MKRFGLRPALGLFVYFLLSSVLGSRSAQAHPTPGSVGSIDFTVDGARLEQDVPIEELERALHQQLIEAGHPPDEAIARHAQQLMSYAAQHVRIVPKGGGAAWVARPEGVVGHASADGPRARFELRFSAPTADVFGSIELHDDLVTHEVISHYTLVYIRSDWSGGDADPQPQLVGSIHAGRNDLSVERQGSFWRGFRGVVRLGAEHIASGSDHLMFLFALVLVAPVVASRRRWTVGRDRRDALVGLARVVTAFTIGHSLTLALGALGIVTAPTCLVEIAIAASILIAALHALRPIFPGREPWVAGGFGLMHGLAFASTLVDQRLGRAQAVWTLFGFNLGIELAQLGLLFLVVPWLILLANTRWYPKFQTLGAGVAISLALGWLLERTTNQTSPFSSPLHWGETHPLVLLLTLALVSIGAVVAERSRAFSGELPDAANLTTIQKP